MRWWAFLLLLLPGSAAFAAVPRLSPQSIEQAQFHPVSSRALRTPDPEIVRAEILLDRARFSPGAIDGLDGDNFRKALRAYQGQSGLPATGRLDQQTWAKLASDKGAVIARYTITLTDAKGPFVEKIPAKMEDQADLKHMGYRTLREELAERFHMDERLLAALNPKALVPGEEIAVAAVPGPDKAVKAKRVVVDKPDRAVEAFGADGKLLAFYPASIGSTDKPAPSGNFEIRRIVHNPDYTYDPKYAFKGVHADKPFTIAPGPNNPVGSVWMDLSYEGYGIHGTPEPENIGKTQSHGCIRLTNWDAENLAAMIDKGTPVSFEDQATGAPPTGPQSPTARTEPAPNGVEQASAKPRASAAAPKR